MIFDILTICVKESIIKYTNIILLIYHLYLYLISIHLYLNRKLHHMHTTNKQENTYYGEVPSLSFYNFSSFLFTIECMSNVYNKYILRDNCYICNT